MKPIITLLSFVFFTVLFFIRFTIYGQPNKNGLIDNKMIGGFSSIGISTSIFNEKSPYNPVLAGILLHFPLQNPNES